MKLTVFFNDFNDFFYFSEGTMNQHKSGTNVQEDVIQLGGDFTVECSSRKMIFLYPSKSASDRPSLEQIFQV